MDRAVSYPDKPAAEPAPAKPSPSPWLRPFRPGVSSGPSALVAWLLVALAAFGMFVSTPMAAGPDEPAQAITAWYESGHGLPPDPNVSYSVPASLWVGTPTGDPRAVRPCFALDSEQGAGCLPSRASTDGTVTVTSSTVNYPPPYYWVVGAGQRIAALAGNQYADIGGRLASVALNLGLLLLLSIYMRRRHPGWGDFLLLVSTPMAVFMGIVVNPSGWEITCGLVLAAALAEAAWGRSSVEPEVWPKSTIAILALASLGLCTARPLGFLWAAGLFAAAIILAPSMTRRTFTRVGAAIAPGIAVGLFWVATHPTIGFLQWPGVVPRSSTLPHLGYWFVESLLSFPNHLHQMFGDLGWLDTPMPELIVLVNIVALTVLLAKLPSIRKAALVLGVFGVVIVPSAIEATGWSVFAHWWQGRYTLPFALGFLLLLLLRSGRLIPRVVSMVSAVAVLSLGVMVWVNAARYAYGLNSLDLPASFRNPQIGLGWLGISFAVGAVLMLASGYLFVRAWLMERETDPALAAVESGVGV